MENFFFDDRFCGELSDLMDIFDIDSENINQLEEDWSCMVEETTLEPIFKTNAKDLCELLCSHNEDRF